MSLCNLNSYHGDGDTLEEQKRGERGEKRREEAEERRRRRKRRRREEQWIGTRQREREADGFNKYPKLMEGGSDGKRVGSVTCASPDQPREPKSQAGQGRGSNCVRTFSQSSLAESGAGPFCRQRTESQGKPRQSWGTKNSTRQARFTPVVYFYYSVGTVDYNTTTLQHYSTSAPPY